MDVGELDVCLCRVGVDELAAADDVHDLSSYPDSAKIPRAQVCITGGSVAGPFESKYECLYWSLVSSQLVNSFVDTIVRPRACGISWVQDKC